MQNETLANKDEDEDDNEDDYVGEDDNKEQDGDEGDEDEILREIKKSGISKSDMARMAPWVRIH